MFIKDQSEYWDYIYSNQEIDGRKYGLLYFTYYILRGFKSKEILNNNQEFTNVLMDIRTNLIGMNEHMNEVRKKNLKFNYNELQTMICECLISIQVEKVVKIGKNFSVKGEPGKELKKELRELEGANEFEEAKEKEYDTDRDIDLSSNKDSKKIKLECNQKLVGHLRRHMAEERIGFEELFDLLTLSNRSDFFMHSKEVLNLKPDDGTLEVATNHWLEERKVGQDNYDIDDLKKMKPSLLDYSRFLVELEDSHLIKYETFISVDSEVKKKVSAHLKQSAIKATEDVNSESLKTSYQNFLVKYLHLFLDEGKYDKEIRYWIDIVGKHMYSTGRDEDILSFLRSLQNIFVRSNKKIYLLRTLQFLLDDAFTQVRHFYSKVSLKDGEKAEEEFAKIQCLFDEAEVPLLCLTVINDNSDPNEIHEACNVLNYMVKNANLKVQNSIYSIFEENRFTQQFFPHIKGRLEEALDLIQREVRFPLQDRSLLEMNQNEILLRFTGTSNLKMVKNLLLVLKYFCDNCFDKFQVF